MDYADISKSSVVIKDLTKVMYPCDDTFSLV